jgi:signal transduction histidine kinase
MSLRARFLALFAVFAVLPLIAIGVFGYVYSMRALEALIAAEVDEIATRSAEQLQQRYQLRESELLLLAQNTETQQLFRALASDDADAWETALGSADAYLGQAWEVMGANYAWVDFRDGAGVSVYRLPPGSGSPGALEGERDAYPSNVMVVERPIFDATGSTEVGALVAAVDQAALLPYDELAVRFGATGYSTVLDRARNTVLHHHSHAYRDQSLSTLLGPQGWNIDPGLMERERGTFTYEEQDTTRVAAFTSLTEPPWTVIASGSLNEFSAPFTQMRNRTLMLVFIVAAAIAVAFTWMTRRETRSLVALTAAADQVGAGDFTPQLPEAASGEVGRLSDAFELMVEKLRETLRQIEESRQMAVVGEFASQVSHEIRNPLTSLKLNLQSLERDVRDGRIPDESARPIEIALREIERLERVVSGVLSLGRPRSTAREARSVHAILDDALELMQAQLNQQRIDVEVDYRAEPDVVVGDAEELKAAFLNLLLNGAEAMPNGGMLRITTDGRQPDRVEVRVADDGPGLSSDARQEIFRPFFSTKEKGTGLGLSLALRTVEEHGGAMSVAEPTRSGRGAEFVVTLPLESEGRGS